MPCRFGRVPPPPIYHNARYAQTRGFSLAARAGNEASSRPCSGLGDGAGIRHR